MLKIKQIKKTKIKKWAAGGGGGGRVVAGSNPVTPTGKKH